MRKDNFSLNWIEITAIRMVKLRSPVVIQGHRRHFSALSRLLTLSAVALVLCSASALRALTDEAKAVAAAASGGEWKVMNYGPFLSATLEVAQGNIANKGIAIRLDEGGGGVAQGHEFFLFETDTLRAAAAWTGSEFIDWKNIAFDGTHEVHAHLVGEVVFRNPDAPGWADSNGNFAERRTVGRDGKRYGPLPHDWGHWRGLYVCSDQVVLAYEVAEASILESPGAEGPLTQRALSRTFNIGPRTRPLRLQVAQVSAEQSTVGNSAQTELKAPQSIDALAREKTMFIRLGEVFGGSQAASDFGTNQTTAVSLAGDFEGAHWVLEPKMGLQLEIPAGESAARFKLLYLRGTAREVEGGAKKLAETSPAPLDLAMLTHGGPPHWRQTITTKVEKNFDARQPYQVESITLPVANPYRSWMRLGAFDFYKDGKRAAVCTWQGDVWVVDGLGGDLMSFNWKRIASGLFQPLGLKIVDEVVYVTCRDQITVLRDLNDDGEADFYENFNNDAQVTEHFHEFAMDLQTDSKGNFYYAKGGRHAKDALVPQHGTLLRVSKDGSTTEILANGFRAPNGVCVNDDGTFIVSDQEGHWTPENRINWVKPGRFYGYMMGYHEPRQSDDFEPPVVWIHKSLDRSPAEQLWVASDRWGLPKNSLISLSYGTGKILGVLYEAIGDTIQGGVFTLPIPPMPTGIMRGRFHPGDGQLYVAGLFGWASDKTKPGGFYRVRYTGKALQVPLVLHATTQGMSITFSSPLDRSSAMDAENYAVSRWTYNRTANYGSDDYKISRKGERGRDPVQVAAIQLSPDKRTVLLQMPDMQPCTQMEIKLNIEAENGTRITQLIENTVQAMGDVLPQ